MKPGRKELDAAYGLAMLEEGCSYNEIRFELARRDIRKLPYTYYAVYNAIKRFKEKLENDCTR